MHARRFYANTQSYSWNRLSSPFGGVISHTPIVTPSIGLNERAHRSYQEMCQRIGIRALSFGDWSRIVDKATARESTAGEVRAFRQFHGYTPSEDSLDRFEITDHITAKSRGMRQAHLGSGFRRTLAAPQAE